MISTYNVIEAAMKLGVRKVIVASSETTYGVCFAEGDKDFHSFPLDESYDSDPMDSYGLSKVVNEKTARAFAMRYGADIYALRIGNVIEPHEYELFPGLPRQSGDPQAQRLELHRCARSRRDRRLLPGERRVWAFRSSTPSTTRSRHASRRAKSSRATARRRRSLREMGEFEAPISNRKTREILGFREQHDWRKYVKP